MTKAYKYILKKNRGVETEANIPYTGKYRDCPKGSGGPIKISGYVESTNRKCSKLKKLIQTGPASVALFADSKFMRYGSGVFKSRRCRTRRVNHAVLLTGCGYKGKSHWQIKNSWGKSWGMDGYMILRKGN